MFSRKPEVVVYLTADFIDIYINNEAGSNKFVFPKELVSDLKIQDREGYIQALFDFLAPLDLPPEPALIVLSQNAIYQKGAPKNDVDLYPELEEFIKNLPLTPGELSKKDIDVEKSRVVIATNKELYLPVVDLLSQKGLKILGIVPASLFLESETDVLMAPEILTILSSGHLLNKSNFLGSSKGGGVMDSGWLSLVLVGVIGAVAAAFWYLFSSPFFK